MMTGIITLNISMLAVTESRRMSFDRLIILFIYNPLAVAWEDRVFKFKKKARVLLVVTRNVIIGIYRMP